jgi:hypothetical protein
MSKPKTSKPTPEDDIEALALSRGGTVKRVAVPVVAKGKPKRNKYGNIRTEYAGMKFDSKAEAAYAAHLDKCKSGGSIRGWSRQPRFMLGVPENIYVGDFLVVEPTGVVHCCDIKGKETAKFKKDKRLWKAYGFMPLWIVKGGKVVEVVCPDLTDRKEGAA